jgi:hypothetical protein
LWCFWVTRITVKFWISHAFFWNFAAVVFTWDSERFCQKLKSPLQLVKL